ncbi:MAG: hypothetical protein ROO73_02280 [Roseivirga sp.]
MKKQSLTQAALTEILIEQLTVLQENLEDTKKIFLRKNELLERIDQHCQQPIRVDTAPIEHEHEKLKATLQEGLCLPRWLVYSGLSLCLVLSLSLVANLQLFHTNRKLRAYVEEANAHIVALSEELKSNKKKKRQ